jgi:hypothetical protein
VTPVRTLAVLVFVVLAVGSPTAGEAAQAPSEAQVKAAFIINFARLSTWPDLAPGASISICTVGDEEVATELAKNVSNEGDKAPGLTVRRPITSDQWKACQVLFLGRAAGKELSNGIPAAVSASVLTVSDNEGFASKGGVIEFAREDSRLRFVVNMDELRKSRVVLSSRVLSLARIIGDVHVR